MLEHVVLAAEVREVVGIGATAAGEVLAVIDVAAPRGHGAAGEPAGLVAHREPRRRSAGTVYLSRPTDSTAPDSGCVRRRRSEGARAVRRLAVSGSIGP